MLCTIKRFMATIGLIFTGLYLLPPKTASRQAGWLADSRKSKERLTVVGGGLERGLGLCGSKGGPDEATAAPQVVLPVVEAPELPGPAVWRQR